MRHHLAPLSFCLDVSYFVCYHKKNEAQNMSRKFIAILGVLMIGKALMCQSYITNNHISFQAAHCRSLASNKFYEHSEREDYVTCLNSETSFSSDEFTFALEKKNDISSISCINGYNLLGYSIDTNVIKCTFGNFLNDFESSTLDFHLDGNNTESLTFYFAKDSNGTIWSSIISMDTAKRYAGQYLGYDLVSEENKNLTKKAFQSASPNSIGVAGSVCGYLKWTDAEGGVHPLIGAKVQITISGSWWSATQYTNNLGYYNISYNDIWYIGSGRPTVTVYTGGENVKVTTLDNLLYSKSNEFDGSSGDWPFSYTFSPENDGDMGKSMMIFQGAYNFAEEAKRLNDGSAISFCNFKYPGSTKGSFYNNGTVYISAKERDNLKVPHYYAAWDVLGHEYGHHIQNYFDLCDNPGGTHLASGNIIDYKITETDEDTGELLYDLEQAKNIGLRLSWAESWPTYWSTVAQSHFSDDLKSINTVGDLAYVSANGVNYEIDRYDYTTRGDADELTIQNILYKLYSSKTDSFDRFSLGEETLWNLVKNNKPSTFSDFVSALYNAGYDKNDIGLLLGKYNVITSSMTVFDNFLDTRPVFTWSSYMGSNYIRFNSFELSFIDENGDEITKATFSAGSLNDISYKIHYSMWSSIYSSEGDTFGVYLAASNTYSLKNGEYYSKLFTFNKPASFSDNKCQIKPNEWGFPARYYFQNEIDRDESVRYSTLHKDGLTITVDRLRCGYIENSYVNLSPRREDAGKAYFEMKFDKPVYSALYGICLWSGNEYLDGEAYVKYLNASGEWVISQNLMEIKLKTRTNIPDRYSIYDMSGIYGMRFEATSSSTGNRNKGRICIDDIVLGLSSDSKENTYAIRDYPKTNP